MTYDAFKGYVCITTFMTMTTINDGSVETISVPFTVYIGKEPVIKPTRHMKGKAAVLLGTILQPWAYRHLRTGPRAEWYRTDPSIASSPRASLKAPVPPQLPQSRPAKQPVSCFRHSCNETSAGFGSEMAPGSSYSAPKD